MNWFRKMSLFLTVQSVLLAALAVSSFGQVTTGNVRGIVKDPSGALVEGATLVVLQK